MFPKFSILACVVCSEDGVCSNLGVCSGRLFVKPHLFWGFVLFVSWKKGDFSKCRSLTHGGAVYMLRHWIWVGFHVYESSGAVDAGLC